MHYVQMWDWGNKHLSLNIRLVAVIRYYNWYNLSHCLRRCVPELLLENIAHYLVAAKRFEVAGIVVEQLDQLSSILTYLLVFMSGSVRAKNPHLRAHLAECLECLVPQEKANSSLSIFCREQLFKTHPLRNHVCFKT